LLAFEGFNFAPLLAPLPDERIVITHDDPGVRALPCGTVDLAE
jgi:hypothetical protein